MDGVGGGGYCFWFFLYFFLYLRKTLKLEAEMEGLCSIYGLRGRGLGLGAEALQDKLYRACR